MKEKNNHPKGWKKHYKFPLQGAMAEEKDRRIAYLNSREHRDKMREIQIWNQDLDHSNCPWGHGRVR